LEHDTGAKQLDELLNVLSNLVNTGLIFTMPNSDTNRHIFVEKISDFCATHTHARAYISLGQLRYLSCIQHADGVLGNSSSGILEVPSFKKGTINIGDRQCGRLRASSVIDCEPERTAIRDALTRLYSIEFQKKLLLTENPYGFGGASNTIVQVLEQTSFGNLLKKKFIDF
jgi:GDP/UDP-N,N'-diacetylbacillosamine 2-epimerase (hydrolysing)